MTALLIITRGIPGSGKSTWAREWVSEDPTHRAEVNRDQLRAMMHGGFVDAERMVTVARDAMIRDLLGRDVDVVCSDTNLPQRTARDLAKLARRVGADFAVKDMTDVPLLTCLGRNQLREDKEPVPERVILDMHNRYVAALNGKPLPPPTEVEETVAADPYVPDPGLQSAVLVDIDGTTALMGSRNPFDETRVHEDRPNQPVIDAVKQEYDAGHSVIFMSGRSEVCLLETNQWLIDNVKVPFIGPIMRPAGDTRKDAVLKRELFDRYVRNHFNVVRVYDDRNQVVQMWRELGLTVLQVAPGDF